jgi:DNA-directed RNA polymerase subunit RPC12/RpoP
LTGDRKKESRFKPMKYFCPACKAEWTQPLLAPGETVRCPHCGVHIPATQDAESSGSEAPATGGSEPQSYPGPGGKLHREYPTIRQSVLLLLFFMLVTVLLIIPSAIIQGMFNINIVDNNFLTALLQILATGIAVFWGFRRTRRRFIEVFPLTRFQPSLLPPTILVITGHPFFFRTSTTCCLRHFPRPNGFGKYS